ncbi:MAG: hypothetical protein DMG02_27185 [Acidobacteria bacterium]|nr:MAG: hypothetical protein DMG02_27185 [Acidobacteriota bacterium]
MEIAGFQRAAPIHRTSRRSLRRIVTRFSRLVPHFTHRMSWRIGRPASRATCTSTRWNGREVFFIAAGSLQDRPIVLGFATSRSVGGVELGTGRNREGGRIGSRT